MPNEHAKNILIIAGEASGDLHGSNLVREVKNLDPDVRFFGVGSKRLAEAGVEMLADASEISVVGGTEVLTHLRDIYRVYSRVKRFLREDRPSLVVLIDFPDFNFLVGKAAKKLGIPVLYYISPQVWAWRRGRVKTMAGFIRAIMVALPFEVGIYRKAGVDVRYVGHPLTDVVRSSYTAAADARRAVGLDPQRRTVALLPGSRTKEIANLLPDMLGAAKLLRDRFPDLQFALPVAHTLKREFVQSFVDAAGVPVTVTDGGVYDVLAASDAAVVTSGTATLETGLMAVPMVIVYRMSKLSFAIGKRIIRVDHVGLVNIVAGKRAVPELLQDDVTQDKIAEAIAPVLADMAEHRRVKNELLKVRAALGEGGASARAAGVVKEILEEKANHK